MNDLTEQWKKGEPLTGWYYIKAIDRFTFPFGIALIIGKEIITTFPHLLDDEIEQVLAPVPSYEEWQSMDRLEKIMLQERARLNKQVIELLEGNTKLKELLKECRQWFDWYHIDTGTGKEYIESWHKKGREIHQKINQALGEDK